MPELAAKLFNIEDCYIDFVQAVMVYARKKPERLNNVMAFLDSYPNSTSSEVLDFIVSQPDFEEDMVCSEPPRARAEAV